MLTHGRPQKSSCGHGQIAIQCGTGDVQGLANAFDLVIAIFVQGLGHLHTWVPYYPYEDALPPDPHELSARRAEDAVLGQSC